MAACNNQGTKKSEENTLSTHIVQGDSLISEFVNTNTPFIQFIPNGYIILDSISGHLNLDEYRDMLLVLKKVNEEEILRDTDNEEGRIVLLLLGDKDNTYCLAAQNRNIIYPLTKYPYGGDIIGSNPLIKIDKGRFSITQEFGFVRLVEQTLSFVYSPDENEWFLNLEAQGRGDSANEDGWRVDYFTPDDFGIISFGEFNIKENYLNQ